MHIQNEALMRKAQEKNQARRAAEEYEKACGRVAFGTLNAYDIVKLWASDEESKVTNVGARAREIVREQNLPLSEMGVGMWQVDHLSGFILVDDE